MILRGSGGHFMVVAVAAFFLIGAAQAVYGVVLPGIAERFGKSASQSGFLVSVHACGALLAMLAGMFARIEALMSSRPSVAAACIGAGALAVGYGPDWILVLCGAGLIGFGYGLITMGLNPAVLYRFQTSGASLLNLLNAIFGLGAILSPVLFVWLGRSVPFVYSALAMAALVLIFLSRGLDDRVPAAIPDRAFIPEPGNVHWSVFVALLLIAIAIGVEACLVWWGPTLLVSNGLSEHAAALHLSAFFFAFVIMRFVGIAIAQIWSPMSVLQFVLPALTAFLVVAQLSPDHSRVMYVCCGALSAALFPNLFVLYTEQLILSVPSTPMILGSAIIGSITMPLFSGLWVDFIGLSSLFAFFAFAVASATLCLVALRVAWVTRDPVR